MLYAIPALATALFLIAMQTPPKQIVSAGPTPVGPYSPAVKAGDFIYVSGTLAQDAEGNMVGEGDVAAQTRRVLDRMREILDAAGSSLDRAVAVTVYLKNAADFATMNEVYRTYWKSDPPTRTTVIADLVLPEALVEMTIVAVEPAADRTVIHPEGWLKSPNPYSYAIRSGQTLFLSGLVSRNGRDNSVVAGDVRQQTKVVMSNAGELLKAAGMTHANVVSARVFLPDTSGFQAMNEVYRGYFPSAPPARATVKAGLAGSQYNVEITMIASAAPKTAVSGGRPANPNLSAGIRAGRMLYLSGMLGNTSETERDVAAQTRETLARIRRTLEEAGAGPQDVVDSLVYLTDLKNFAPMNDAYRAFFGKDFPARTTVQSGLVAPDGLVEIMMTAVAR